MSRMNLTRRSGGSTPRRRGTVDDLLQIGNTGNPVPRLSFPIFLWEFTCTELEISGCRISPCRRACRPITANGQHCARAVPSKSKTGTWRRRPEASQRGALGGSARSSLRACPPCSASRVPLQGTRQVACCSVYMAYYR